MSRTSRSVVLSSVSLLVATAFVSCGGDATDALSNGINPNAQTANANNQMVTIPMNAAGQGPAAFGTNPLVISAGTTVTWMNSDSVAHTSTSDTGVWDTGPIQPGAQSSPVPFPSPGTFPYHCTIHGAQSMSGVIQVTQASPSPGPSGTPSSGPSTGPGVTPAAAPSEAPSVTPEATPSESPTPSPSVSPTETPTPTFTSTPSGPSTPQQKS